MNGLFGLQQGTPSQDPLYGPMPARDPLVAAMMARLQSRAPPSAAGGAMSGTAGALNSPLFAMALRKIAGTDNAGFIGNGNIESGGILNFGGPGGGSYLGPNMPVGSGPGGY